MVTKVEAAPEYRAGQEFRDRVFQEGWSYLWPDRRVWNPENLDALIGSFLAPKDDPHSSFFERLQAELTDQPIEVHQLAADSLLLFYLFPSSSSVTAPKKIDSIERLMSWKQLGDDRNRALLAQTFGLGIGGVGRFYLTAQPWALHYFWQFALQGKKQAVNFSLRPECEELADAVRDKSKHSTAARHALMHLLFPDYYEPIVSDKDKARIVAVFGDEAARAKSVDEALHIIRMNMSTEFGPAFSFYDPDVLRLWKPADSRAGQPDSAMVGEAGIPSYQELMLPYLKLLSDGGEHKESELLEPLADFFNLTDDDLAKKVPSGNEGVFKNRIRWAKVNLRHALLVEIPRDGYTRITQRGRELLDEKPADLSRSLLRRFPEYDAWVTASNDGLQSAKRGKVWIEKTIVRGRSDRESGPHALGKALWSPQRDRRGADLYRFMRDVQPGDIVLHLTDNEAFTGLSRAAGSYREFMGVGGTEWGEQASYMVPLEDYKVITPPLTRDVFLSDTYGQRLLDLKRSGQRNLFYTSSLELSQGAYLTPAPRELVDILNDAYMDMVGRQLIETPIVEIQPIAVPASTFEDLKRATLWDEDALNELLDTLSADKPSRQIILTGPPGTGKTWVALQLVRHLTQADPLRSRIVQFHPSFAYEEFIEGLRPVATESGGIAFRPVPGIVLQMVEMCRKSALTHYLIIDEMNRANLTRVLGELMYLFEYRDEVISLPYTKDFSLPPNLFFIGTMNTADRSIRSIDLALRRRFEIFECPPNRRILERYYESHTNQVSDLFSGFEALNELLTEKLDRYHAIGQTFFMASVFSPKDLRNAWTRKIEPIIAEYFFDQPDQQQEFKLEKFWPSLGTT